MLLQSCKRISGDLIMFCAWLMILGLLTVLGTVDAILIHHAFRTTIASGASVQMVFGFEVSDVN